MVAYHGSLISKHSQYYTGTIPSRFILKNFIYLMAVTLLHLIFKYQKECKRHLRKAEYEYINQKHLRGAKKQQHQNILEIYKIKTTRCRRNCTSEKGSKFDQRQQRERRTHIRPIQVSLY